MRELASVDEAFPLEAELEAADAHRCVITQASTSFVTGARADLAELASACHERDMCVLLDGVQIRAAVGDNRSTRAVDSLSAS